MSLFEFLMVLLSIIIGLGISELLTGFARIVRAGRIPELCLAHGALLITLFIVLLQVFWESWALNVLTRWTFGAMLLMLATPVLLYLVTHIVLLKLRDRSPEARQRIGELLASMEGQVPQLTSLEVGCDVLQTDRSYDVALIARFATWDDAEDYQEHRYHRQVLAELQPALDSAIVVDYESGQ